MLRSLVGSEMCIRDRQEFDSPYKNTLQCILDCFERLAQYEDAEEQGLLVCLLYTSDAADDLLCVDLGGRRILKKKNYI